MYVCMHLCLYVCEGLYVCTPAWLPVGSCRYVCFLRRYVGIHRYVLSMYANIFFQLPNLQLGGQEPNKYDTPPPAVSNSNIF